MLFVRGDTTLSMYQQVVNSALLSLLNAEHIHHQSISQRRHIYSSGYAVHLSKIQPGSFNSLEELLDVGVMFGCEQLLVRSVGEGCSRVNIGATCMRAPSVPLPGAPWHQHIYITYIV